MTAPLPYDHEPPTPDLAPDRFPSAADVAAFEAAGAESALAAASLAVTIARRRKADADSPAALGEADRALEVAAGQLLEVVATLEGPGTKASRDRYAAEMARATAAAAEAALCASCGRIRGHYTTCPRYVADGARR